jgi:hypothetical protein
MVPSSGLLMMRANPLACASALGVNSASCANSVDSNVLRSFEWVVQQHSLPNELFEGRRCSGLLQCRLFLWLITNIGLFFVLAYDLKRRTTMKRAGFSCHRSGDWGAVASVVVVR